MGRNTIIRLFAVFLLSYEMSCGTMKTPQQSPGKPDTVTVMPKDREIFVVSVSDAIPNEDGTWNGVEGATISLWGSDQVRVIDFDTLGGIVHFYDVPEVFTLRATHPDYEPGEMIVNMKEKKRRAPNRPRYGAAIFLEKEKANNRISA